VNREGELEANGIVLLYRKSKDENFDPKAKKTYVFLCISYPTDVVKKIETIVFVLAVGQP
jgi:hypothetical protein